MKTYRKLPLIFYKRNCITIAKELLEKILVRKIKGKFLAGIIVETEAYLGEKDEASHSYRGKTKRNEVMFGEGGFAYVYFTYGNHHCVNVVIGKKDTAHAVLIRALQPLEGIEKMKTNRKQDEINNLTNGPGKLTQALRIDLKLNGVSLISDELFIAKNSNQLKIKIEKSKRIGITKNADKLWRFFIKDNPFVSHHKKKIK